MAASPPDGARQFGRASRLRRAIDAITVNTRSQFGVMRNSRQGTRERAISMRRAVKRLVLYAVAALVAVALAFVALIVWPKPLFAFSLGAGRIVVSSDRPIPRAAGERVLRDCERLLERSPLVAQSPQYRLYVANEDWHHRLYFIPSRE